MMVVVCLGKEYRYIFIKAYSYIGTFRRGERNNLRREEENGKECTGCSRISQKIELKIMKDSFNQESFLFEFSGNWHKF